MNTVMPLGETTGNRQGLALLGWLALCFAASSTAVFVSTDGWYATLAKPAWNPPAWVFGPVWSALYIMMAVAAWMVWRHGGWSRQSIALGCFVVQLVLNALWTPLFFGLHRPDLALVDIVAMWVAIVATLALFSRVEKTAAVLLMPYLAWVSFATVLNYTIWTMQ